MTFSVRAAIAIACFCAVSLTGSGTPGFAFELDKSLILPSPLAADQSGPLVAGSRAQGRDLSRIMSSIVPPVAEDEATAAESGSDDQTAYATLAAAVAAQDVADRVDSDMACLAGAVYFEAKGEPLAGQLAVAQVVLNRSTSGRFPQAICSVVTQPGQFSFIRGGKMPNVDTSTSAYRTALAVAQVAVDKAWNSPAPDALYFHARHVAPRWRLTKVTAIGRHVFYR